METDVPPWHKNQPTRRPEITHLNTHSYPSATLYYVLLFLLGWLASSEFEHGWKHDVRTQHKTKFVFRRCNVELSRNVTESRHFDSISLRRSYASGEKLLPKQTTTRKLLTTRSVDERQIPTADSSKTQDLTSKLFRLISSCVLFCLYLGGMSLQFKDLSTGSFRCTSCTLAKGSVCFPGFSLEALNASHLGARSVWLTNITEPLRLDSLRQPQSDSKCTGGKENKQRAAVRVSL